MLVPDHADRNLGEERDLKFNPYNKTVIDRFLYSNSLIPDDMALLTDKFENLILHSVTSSTWKKHGSAWSSFSKFCKAQKTEFSLPISVEKMRAYITWAVTDGKLKASTAESYMSSLKLAHTLSNITCMEYGKDRCIQMLLKGAENVDLLKNAKTVTRCAMNIHILKIIGHKIHETNWDPLSKQLIWTASTVSFYSSCRMGEILSENKSYFDPKTTLKWENVHFQENNEIIVQIPFTKTTGMRGAFINMFPIDNSTCPVAAVKELCEMCKKRGFFEEKKPVFRFHSGIFLTTKTMNEILEKLLKELNTGSTKITCHSFRAAIPSAIAAHPDKVTVQEVKDWGKWRSDSYKKYTRQDREKDRVLFYKTLNLL